MRVGELPGRSSRNSQLLPQLPPIQEEQMKALVYHGPGKRSWGTVADPSIIDPTDIVVRIDTSTICGTDLHILKGDVPETTPGTILGHEAVGEQHAVGRCPLDKRAGQHLDAAVLEGPSGVAAEGRSGNGGRIRSVPSLRMTRASSGGSSG